MDNRKNNGGHSTRSNGVDKRKNKYKDALPEAATVEEVVQVLKVLKAKSLDGDMHAMKLLLAYYLGNPTNEVLNTNINIEEKEITPEVATALKLVIENTY